MRLLRRPLVIPEVVVSSLSTAFPIRDEARATALLLSPHPDDECLVGALPLRLQKENNWRIINVAVTLGSNKDRQAARKSELAKACSLLSFDCMLADNDGFSEASQKTRQDDIVVWQNMVSRLSQIIAYCKPQAIFLPHASDAHPTHCGTHWLGIDALSKLETDFTTSVVQTEYWQPLEDPNLMVGLSEKEVTTLLSALSCHSGENARNPFDTRFPAYLIDNVRRGSERIGGKGTASPPMDFSMIYKIGIWRQRKFIPSALKRIVGITDAIGDLFE